MIDPNHIVSVFLDVFDHRPIESPQIEIADLSIEDAYRVQSMVVDRRIGRGERPVGYKVGCTSSSIRRQFGLTDPICARVMAPHVFFGNTRLAWADYYQPAVEPEFVFMMAHDLRDEVGDGEPIERAIEFVSPGIEIHNYQFWFGKPTLQELIASGGIHAGLVVGDHKVRPDAIDWEMEGVGIFKSGALTASGIAAEIMGGPMISLRWLVNHLVRRGDMLKAGDLVIPGSPVQLVPVDRGDRVTARFTHVGTVDATFE